MRIIDVEKEALLVVSEALQALGDAHAIFYVEGGGQAARSHELGGRPGGLHAPGSEWQIAALSAGARLALPPWCSMRRPAWLYRLCSLSWVGAGSPAR